MTTVYSLTPWKNRLLTLILKWLGVHHQFVSLGRDLTAARNEIALAHELRQHAADAYTRHLVQVLSERNLLAIVVAQFVRGGSGYYSGELFLELPTGGVSFGNVFGEALALAQDELPAAAGPRPRYLDHHREASLIAFIRALARDARENAS
jgi:hypothetical protein